MVGCYSIQETMVSVTITAKRKTHTACGFQLLCYCAAALAKALLAMSLMTETSHEAVCIYETGNSKESCPWAMLLLLSALKGPGRLGVP